MAESNNILVRDDLSGALDYALGLLDEGSTDFSGLDDARRNLSATAKHCVREKLDLDRLWEADKCLQQLYQKLDESYYDPLSQFTTAEDAFFYRTSTESHRAYVSWVETDELLDGAWGYLNPDSQLKNFLDNIISRSGKNHKQKHNQILGKLWNALKLRSYVLAHTAATEGKARIIGIEKTINTPMDFKAIEGRTLTLVKDVLDSREVFYGEKKQVIPVLASMDFRY